MDDTKIVSHSGADMKEVAAWLDDLGFGRYARSFIEHPRIEVTHVSVHGFWVLLGDEELSLPFTEFPWFSKATIEQLSDVRRPTENHLYWLQLDIDLSVESIRDPAAFPLISRVGN